MDENVFRIVVTVAVVVASLAFVVQAGIMFAILMTTRKTKESADKFLSKLEPVIAKAEPAIQKADGVIAKVGPLMDRLGPVIDQAVPAIRRVSPLLDEAKTVATKAGKLVDRATDIAITTNMVIADVRPQVKAISQEAAEITRTGREQVERIGDLIHDVGDKTRSRLDQIDRGVDQTLEQVHNVGGAMKTAVLKPVREVNGLAAGVAAAVSTLVRGQRRHSVDSATQDEEMFI